ncbi:MAG: YtxH domain-containing protein [Bacteroidales bacterium]|nr:YtxH domain-containing protein [Bacteroidales bacterium]
MKNLGKIIGAMTLGAITGAAIGVLFAPNKGSKTRQKITTGAKDVVEDLRKKMDNEARSLRKKAKDLKGRVLGKVDDSANEVIKKAEALKHHN